MTAGGMTAFWRVDADKGTNKVGRFFQRYLLPGFVFQSVVIGGGYGTGRELAEFFLPHGPLGGLLGMLVAMAVWAAVLAVTFEFARLTKSYDYRTFFRNLLGPFWILFEIIFIVEMTIALSVVGAASGELVAEAFGVPKIFGTSGLLISIIILVFYGTKAIEKFLSIWSLLLYAVYFVFLVAILSKFGSDVAKNLAAQPADTSWIGDGVRYAGYNMAVIPAVLFAIKHQEKRKEAITSGLLAGLIAIVPAIFFYLGMAAFYPEINDVPVPATYILGALSIVWLAVVFKIMLYGTFIETGSGLIHSINERLAANFRERGVNMSKAVRPLVAFVMLGISVFLATSVGLIDLVAKGYGILTYGFIAIYIIPVLTIGVVKVLKHPSSRISDRRERIKD